MSDIARFFKHSTIYTIGNLFNRIGAFVLLPVYTNYLTVGEYGTIELFYIISSVATGFLAIGIAHATLRFYFDYDDLSDQNASVSTNYIGSFCISIIGISVLALFSGELTERLFETKSLQIGMYLVFATLVFELSSQICLAYIRAIEQSKLFVIISIAKLVIQVVINSYLVIVENAGVIGVLVGNLATVFLGWAILSIYTLKRCGISFHWSKFVPVIKYSYPFLLSTIMALIANNADKFILNHLMTVEALGVYALALKFSMLLEQMIGEPFSKSYGAFRYTIMNRDNAGNLQADIVRYLLIMAVFSGLAISLFVEDLLIIMSKPTFWAAADLVPILMLASIFKLIKYPIATGILFAKKTKYFFYFTSLAAFISPILNFSLISYIGLFGACVSLVIIQALLFFLMNHYSQKYFEVRYDIVKILLIIFPAVATYLMSILFEPSSMVLDATFKLVLLLIYVAIVFKSPAITSEEIEKLQVFIKTKMLRKRIAKK